VVIDKRSQCLTFRLSDCLWGGRQIATFVEEETGVQPHPKRDYYEVLGVERTCTAQELKSSFRKLALQFHPDKNEGDKKSEEKFKELSEAYEVLSDPEKRARYDRFGHQAPGGFGPSPFDQGFGGANINDIFEGIFGDIFGGGGRRGRTARSRGSDLRYNLRSASRKPPSAPRRR